MPMAATEARKGVPAQASLARADADCESRPSAAVLPKAPDCRAGGLGDENSNLGILERVGSYRLWRSGVRFNCPECGRLWRDDPEHREELPETCPACSGSLALVGKGDSAAVGDADWFRCLSCRRLFMRRRGEIVPSQPRNGFSEFT